MKRTIRLRESELRRMIAESVKRVLNEGTLNELWGGSSAPGTRYNYNTGGVEASQGGAYGHNGLDDLDAQRAAEKNRAAQQQQNNQEKYRQWCYNNYDYVMSMCPGYMNGGEYEKAYRYCN